MKRIIAIVALLLLPMAAGAQTFNVNLDGGAGTGFATIIIDGSDINYTIISSGLDPAPNDAELTDGSDTVDLAADFGGTGTASGTVNSSFASDIAANPSAWTLNVSNGTDTLSGVLGAGGGGTQTVVYFPVSASNPGANQTYFRTDARIVNRSGEATTATLEFYANDDGGNTEPDATETVDVDVNEQLVLEDFLVNLFGYNTAEGAVKVSSDRSLIVASRVYNDQTSVDAGTQGLFVDAVDMSQAYRTGLVSFLQNRTRNSGGGLRGAVGWFNPNSSEVTLTLYGWDTDGTLLGSETVTVAGLEQKQQSIQAVWPALAGYGDMYVTYTASNDIFVYGTIADNVSGDGTYVPATQSP
ncbi:MAG: hypothetical protein AMS21_06745 [Gemmatimonas sp. SG8_38_2]|nr:MAG: hypothetical protein AMS21_06745 [Gemmatimonas sp. SG8_38_2]